MIVLSLTKYSSVPLIQYHLPFMLPKYCIALDTPFDSPLTSIPTSGAPEMDHIIMRDEHECDNPKRGFFTRCNY